MRYVFLILFASITIALVLLLDTQLPVGGSKTPKLGSFLSPQHGFWQNAEPADVNFNQTLKIDRLSQPVDVYFDERLVPHIYAANERDAYYVQGYLHAKFRLWQMEFQTHAAAGRLSEILGPQVGDKNFVAIDQYFRRSGMVYGAEKSLIEMEANPTTKKLLDAYTAGVNTYIRKLKPNQYSIEYKLLDYAPELWTNLKTSLFLKYMSRELAGGEYDFEMTNAKNVFSAAEIEMLYPVSQDSLDPMLPKETVFDTPRVAIKKPAGADSLYYSYRDSIIVPPIIKPNKNNGSNNWAVSGSKTSSGAPILCNDPHLGLNMPSLWYEMQITAPGLNVYGATFPGAPSVIIGFNDSCAWGVTNAGRDVKDYYEITFRDTTMQEYWYDSTWTKSTFRKEVIKVRGQPDVVENIAMTVFGPVMYDRHYANKLNDGKCYALRWKAHDASNELLTFYKLDHARNFPEYIKAISTYKCPGQNFVFAAKNGDIAIRQQGEFPAKWRRQGDFVMPGTDTSYRWQYNIPNRENPLMFNPERGYVSSANQMPVSTAYPYYLGGSFPVYRGMIINRKLGQMTNITTMDMQALQTDNYNIFAEFARPVLLKYLDISKLNSAEKNYLDKLMKWNLRNDIDEEGPTIFTTWWDDVERGMWADEFAKTSLPLKWPDEVTLLESLLKDSVYAFADDVTTSDKEVINDVVLKAYKTACARLQKAEADGNLHWGDFKNTGIRHLLSIPVFSRLHLPIGGGSHVISATREDHGPGWRMIVSLTEKTEAYAVYPGGQSGNPGSKYYDTFVDTWVAGKYYTLLFVPASEAAAEKRFVWKTTFEKG